MQVTIFVQEWSVCKDTRYILCENTKSYRPNHSGAARQQRVSPGESLVFGQKGGLLSRMQYEPWALKDNKI
jgi:hypothetical protein